MGWLRDLSGLDVIEEPAEASATVRRPGSWGVLWRGGLLGLAAMAWAALAVVPGGAVERVTARAVTAGMGEAGAAILREVWGIVNERFYDPDLHGVDVPEVIAEYGNAAERARTEEELRDVVNDSLGKLGASHTRWFTPDEQAFYEVLDIFRPGGLGEGEVVGQPGGPVRYVGIGCVTAEIDGRRFVTDVYPTGPADQGGLRVGDEIVSVDGAPWADAASFRGKARREVEIVVRRAAGAGPTGLVVRPDVIQPRQLYQRAVRASARVEERGDLRLAYVRLRSYAHPSYQEILERLMREEFDGADGLVLDLRGGWGGAQASYTNAFNPALPHMEMRGRDGPWRDVARVWDRPVVVLVDAGTRSGKEMIADALQRAGVATVVGTRTAGAVLGGSAFPLSDGSLLMVAVSDVRLDGRRLEGRGVEPDVLVEQEIPYCNGADAPRERAMEILGHMVAAGRGL